MVKCMGFNFEMTEGVYINLCKLVMKCSASGCVWQHDAFWVQVHSNSPAQF